MKKTNFLIKILMILGIMFVLSLVVNLNTAKATSGEDIFDYKLYADSYADLKAAYGYNKTSLYNHYITYGLNEGRIGSLVFDQTYYVSRYSDLATAYGTNYGAAFNHFITYGIAEGRQGAITFDVSYYLSAYSDLQSTFGSKGYEEAIIHYLNYGVSEGRSGSLQFNIKYYLVNNSDLMSAYGNGYRNGIIHFIQYGLAEGRKASSNFIIKYYKANYNDLQEAFGSDNLSYFIHYMNYGLAEGRIATYSINYVLNYEKAEELANLINTYRSENGLNTLSITLTEYAMVRAGEITTLFSHTRPDGSDMYSSWGITGEIITAGSSMTNALESWQASSGHNYVMLLKGYTQIGVGVAAVENDGFSWADGYLYYCVALFY